MQNLRAALLTAIGLGLIALAITSIVDRDSRARLDRALGPTPLIQTVSSVTAAPLAQPASRN